MKFKHSKAVNFLGYECGLIIMSGIVSYLTYIGRFNYNFSKAMQVFFAFLLIPQPAIIWSYFIKKK